MTILCGLQRACTCVSEPTLGSARETLGFCALEENTVSESVLEPGPQDYDRINVLVEAELEYWTKSFGVTRARLAAAIQEVGPRIPDLRRVLGEPH
jgi:hypothetical protein